MAERKITLVTMGQGNVLALKKTLESFKGIVDEVVYGDMLLFEEDREVVMSYQKEFNLRRIELPFNYIFQMGFSNCLNFLISNAKNDMVLYMNTSEAIDEDYGINDIINGSPDSNMFYFSHRVESHRWFRCFDRRELQWSGQIHEEPRGIERPYHKPIFMMKDFEKDMDDSRKAYIFNRVKEIVYDSNYLKLIDRPKEIGATNDGWIRFVKDQYDVMKNRTLNHEFYEAFSTGDFYLLQSIIWSPDFQERQLESSFGMNFQGVRKDIL